MLFKLFWSVFMYLLIIFYQLPKRKYFVPNALTDLRSQILFNSVVSGTLLQPAACRRTDPECCWGCSWSWICWSATWREAQLAATLCLAIRENSVICGEFFSYLSFFAVGWKQFCFLCCKWISKPSIITNSDCFSSAIKSKCSKCREVLTL